MKMFLSLLQLEQLQKLNGSNQSGKILDQAKLKKEFISKLKHLSGNPDEKNIDPVDEEVINRVSLLFQYLIEGQSLPKQIQEILLQLQVPYLIIAIKDHSIFSETNHVARQLLEKLSEASLGWSEKHDFKGKFINHIKDLVEHIIKTDPEKINFYSLMKEFDTFQDENKQLIKISEKRASDKALDMERLNSAKRKTAAIMKKNMYQHSIPKLVKEILLENWVNVLTLEFLCYADDKKRVQPKLDFVQDLIIAAQRNKKRKTPAAKLDELCSQFETELRNLTYNETDIKSKSSEMNHLLTILNFDINDDSMFTLDEDDDLAPYKIDEPIIDTNALDRKQIQSDINAAMNFKPIKEVEEKVDDFAEQAAAMKLGTWIEIKINEEFTRAKLSWISPITGTRLIVNSRGQKLCNLTLSELAQGLRVDDIYTVVSKPLFERVLKSMFETIDKV